MALQCVIILTYGLLKRGEIMKKGRKFLKLIYGRSILVILMVLVQLFVLLSFFTILSSYKLVYSILSTLLTFVLLIVIINNKSNPVFKLAWLIPILAFPVFGGLFYLFFMLQSGSRLINKRMKKIFETTKPILGKNEQVEVDLDLKSPHMSNLGHYITFSGGYPVYENTDVTYFPLGEDKFEALIPELEKAEKFIFLEYFIIDFGYMWDTILEILKRKASEGVEVRVMYDGLCCLTLLPFNYPDELEKFGIKCKMFSPIRPALSSYQNNRDHRKIFVIDGKVAFNGGINLADEYINRKERFGHWKDTAVMLKGDAVKSFTVMFLEMWNITEKEFDNYIDYILPQPTLTQEGRDKGFVIPYGDSPLDDITVGKDIYLDILNSAERYVHIMTPYLILDNELITALLYAVRRGVEVSIILPHITDKPTAFALARNHYPQLLESGVEIYEYTPGFVHAKVFTSDDTKAVVGSINMDYRSLYLHYECATLMYRCPAVEDIEKDFQDTKDKCMRITMEDYKKFPVTQKIRGILLKFIAPLM